MSSSGHAPLVKPFIPKEILQAVTDVFYRIMLNQCHTVFPLTRLLVYGIRQQCVSPFDISEAYIS
jgi:hypothetical protein